MARRYQNWLTLVWIGGAAVIILIVVVRLFQRSAEAQPLLDWLSPHLAPTLLLVCGVAAGNKPAASGGAASSLRGPFIAAMAVSIIYLLILIAAVLAAAITAG